MRATTSQRASDSTRSAVRRTGAPRALVLASAVALAAGVACKDTAVPFFDAPSSVPLSTTGIQNAVTGLFSASRVDVSWYVYYAASFSRDVFWFLGASANVLTDVGGLKPITNNGIQAGEVWDNEYAQIKQANTIVTNVAKVTDYSAAQQAAITGVVQTVKALNFMMLAETRDTLGIPLYAVDGNPTDPPYCNKDVWAYIVALLDSANADLTTAGPIPLPVKLPAGFASVGATAAPSTAAGSFAAFNRALAGKAGLEYAYAKARGTGAGPTLTTPGTLDGTILTSADAALTSSALYDLTAIQPPTAGPFALDAHGVFHTFSGQSGDLANGLIGSFFLYDALFDLQNDVDVAHDLRWQNKFVRDGQPLQLAQYAGTSDTMNYLPYSNVASSFPIVRAEELALVRAQIQLGLGNLAAAITLINTVHQQAGGFATPLTIASTYTAVRDTLLKEQRISTVFEASGDRMIALRMYHLEAVADTTWQAHAGPDKVVDDGLGGATDYHTTVASVPQQEVTARGNQWSLTCP